LALPRAPIAPERLELRLEHAPLGLLQPGLRLLEPARQTIALVAKLIALRAQRAQRDRRLLDALSEPLELLRPRARLVPRCSLSWPPRRFPAAATIRSCVPWTWTSVSVRSGFWNLSANARLFMPGGAWGPS